MMTFSSAIAIVINALAAAAPPASGASGASASAPASAAPSAAANLVRDPYAGGIFGMPGPYSTDAHKVDLTYNWITWISIFFFLLNVGVMVWFIVKYRRRSPTEFATSDVTHNTPLELTWTIIP